MKKRFCLLLLLLTGFCFSVFSQGTEYNQVQDFAKILSTDEVETLEAIAEDLSEKCRIGFYIVIVSDMADYEYNNIELFGEAVYHDLNYGMGEDKNGLMLILSMADRDYDLTCFGQAAHKAFTDFGKDKLARKTFIPYFRSDNWYDGFRAFLYGAAEYASYAEEGTPIDVNFNPRTEGDGMEIYQILLIAFGIAFVIGLITCLALRAPMKKVKIAKNASNYIDSSKVDFAVKYDHYSHRRVTSRKIETSSSSGGTSVGSSGFSHSSGKF